MDIVAYFTGASQDDPVITKINQEMIRFIKSLGYTLLTKNTNDLIEHNLFPEIIERNIINKINKVSHFIAEVSFDSTEIGREIEFARQRGKKILCLWLIERENNVTPMIRGMTSDRYPNVIVRPYHNLSEAKLFIRTFLVC